jgi:hypothetical protein
LPDLQHRDQHGFELRYCNAIAHEAATIRRRSTAALVSRIELSQRAVPRIESIMKSSLMTASPDPDASLLPLARHPVRQRSSISKQDGLDLRPDRPENRSRINTV